MDSIVDGYITILNYTNTSNITNEYNDSIPTTTTATPVIYYKLSQLALILQHIYYYSFPVVLVLGSIGNILAYLVFTRTKLKKVTTCRYLSAIGITDTGYLWTTFATHLQLYYSQPFLNYVGICQFVFFLNNAFSFLCIWYMVALVTDRFISLYFPLKKSSMCTVFRAKIVIVGFAAMATASYSYTMYFFGVHKSYGRTFCSPFPEFHVHYMNLDKIDIIFVAIIPYIVIIILVMLILCRSCEYYRISASADLSPLSETRRRLSRQKSSENSTRLSRILSPIILVTLLFNSPQNIMRAYMRFMFQVRPNPSIKQWLDLCRFFYLLNFALKGYLYFVFSPSFRKCLFNFLCERILKIKQFCLNRRPESSNPQVIKMEETRTIKNATTGLLQTAI